METSAGEKLDPSELPFLVTHWLANFDTPTSESQDAVQRIRDAASEMASAFSQLGLFGTLHPPRLSTSHSRTFQESYHRATYEDLKRKWSHVSPHQLEFVAESAVAASSATVPNRNRAQNLIQLAHEQIMESQNGGRRVGEILDLTPSTTSSETHQTERVKSLLQSQKLILLTPSTDDSVLNLRHVDFVGPGHVQNSKIYSVGVVSNFEELAHQSGEAMRKWFALRDRSNALREEINALQKSIKGQEESKRQILHRLQALPNAAPDQFAVTDEMQLELQNCGRVLAQIGQKVGPLLIQHDKIQAQVTIAQQEAFGVYRRCTQMLQRFRDPDAKIGTNIWSESSLSRNKLTNFLVARQTLIRAGRPTSAATATSVRGAVLRTRLSHALTISAHLHFPVYCLKFDKTGRYFATGADDCLVKVFFLGAAPSQRGKPLRFNYGANERGAVLVCTLRGHAGVICDIEVSSDNSFLATASDDGDVRIWGLKDGCQIAILRGHSGGANMVSWSKTTPFRLVTSGMDGLARIWDIREGALKRYGAHIGKRAEYTLSLTDSEKRSLGDDGDNQRMDREGQDDQLLLPPLPQREESIVGRVPPLDPAANVALPPAPGAPDPNDDIGDVNAELRDLENDVEAGAFVANATLDEGVRIVAKLQHGEPLHQDGIGTRSRLKAVKVICVARCPVGGHFATGSDDGICRVWEDQDDERVAVVDSRGKDQLIRNVRRNPSPSISRDAAPSTSALLASLVGHMSSITDLHYSNAGDRILSAAQKDGMARIWSFGGSIAAGSGHMRKRFQEPKQIVLRLSGIGAGRPQSSSASAGRRRGNSSSNAAVSTTCDVAVWTSDDCRIITSQACAKPNGKEIVPGSQVLLVWDSWTGNCLMAINQAHQKQCPVLVPHPMESNIFCSAGADGVAKVWDLERGRCIFTHVNTVEFGPVAQNNEDDRTSGYLDGSFDPHGLQLILTDDNGRITLVDSFQGPLQPKRAALPAWMREQYFANDYYELFYNTNGYCVERGSEQPPHLAPRAVRCNHAASGFSDDVSETFRFIKGPSPMSEEWSLAQRNAIRAQKFPDFRGAGHHRRAILMTDFDPDRSIVVHGSTNVVDDAAGLSRTRISQIAAPDEIEVSETITQTQRSSSGRTLSRNYRWRDYDDLMRDQPLNEGIEDDDEEFVPVPRSTGRRGAAVGNDISSADDEDLQEIDESDHSDDDIDFTTQGRNRINQGHASDRSMRTRRRNHLREREVEAPVESRRSSSRRRAAEFDESEEDEEDVFAASLSTNNSPYGPFLNDYVEAGHLFKLDTSSVKRVKRAWLLRSESSLSYKGRKMYAPQVGDSVVYIPRAHQETIRVFPTLKAPWRCWPLGSRWPVVRCKVLHIRYRFPYKDYFKRRGSEQICESVVAILTLEITGIPTLSSDREFPWPRPGFVETHTRSSTQKFEVSLFQNTCPDYILPEVLFLWRVQCLEEALRKRGNNPSGLKFCTEYNNHSVDEDPVNERGEINVIEFGAEKEDHDEHLNKSGFETLIAQWIDDDSTEILSPWEVTTPQGMFSAPSPPSLGPELQRAVSNTLRYIEHDGVFEDFVRPVNVERFADYLARVEVPMDLSFVKKRLEGDFYTSLGSVLSDIKLIKENCEKYNGPDAEIVTIATELNEEFKAQLKRELVKLDADPDSIAALDNEADLVLNSSLSTPRANDGPRTRSAGRSSLELLPPPPNHSTRPQRVSDAANRSRATNGHSDTPVLGRTGNAVHGNETKRGERRGTGTRTSNAAASIRPDQSQRRASRSSALTSSRKRVRYDEKHSDEFEDTDNSESHDDAVSEDLQDEYREESEDESEGNLDEPELQFQRPTRRAARNARKSYSRHDKLEEEFVEEETPDDDVPPGRRPSRRDATKKSYKRPEESSTRHSPRRRKVTVYREDVHSDIEMRQEDKEYRESSKRDQRKMTRSRHFDDESDDGDDEEIVGGRNTRRSSTAHGSDRPSRRSASLAPKYQEVDSDVDEIEDSQPSAHSKRGSNGKGTSPPAKRSRRASTEDIEAGLPRLSQWPHIPLRKITEVTHFVMSTMESMDADGIFAIPVVEAVPSIKKAYLARIKHPLDFRAIKEDRVHSYQEIRELQDDLIQIFKNCVEFNGTDSEYGVLAMSLWEQMNEVFQNACKECGVRLAAGWMHSTG